MKYLGFENKSIFCEDENRHWYWTAYYFMDAKGEQWTGKSPVYTQYGSDLYCLQEDSIQVDCALRQGASWEQVCGKFRQAS